mmetsp:Transcript_15548/g.44206  ORF Transcript_15548/g.44206 Transcript_15548/m.44206 type:complete len:177 (+) Transcript_15548:486-1016(+)
MSGNSRRSSSYWAAWRPCSSADGLLPGLDPARWILCSPGTITLDYKRKPQCRGTKRRDEFVLGNGASNPMGGWQSVRRDCRGVRRVAGSPEIDLQIFIDIIHSESEQSMHLASIYFPTTARLADVSRFSSLTPALDERACDGSGHHPSYHCRCEGRLVAARGYGYGSGSWLEACRQ